MDRIKYGEEARFAGVSPAPDERCPVCWAKPGEYHYQGCVEEECPQCHEVKKKCSCTEC